jgi:hypothetical protein
MYNALKRHPAAFGAIFCFLVYFLPLAIFGVWGSFSEEKIPVWLARKGYPSVLKVAIAWLAISLVLSFLAYLVFVYVLPSKDIPVVHLSYALDRLRDHDRMALDNYQQVEITNEGPGIVFHVKVSDIAFGNGRVGAFSEIPSVRVGASVPVEIEILENDVPVFARRDLAHALHDSVIQRAGDAWEDGRQDIATISYPLSVKYRDNAGRLFESTHEIRAYEPPAFQRIRTDFVKVKEIRLR